MSLHRCDVAIHSIEEETPNAARRPETATNDPRVAVDDVSGDGVVTLRPVADEIGAWGGAELGMLLESEVSGLSTSIIVGTVVQLPGVSSLASVAGLASGLVSGHIGVSLCEARASVVDVQPIYLVPDQSSV